MKFKKSNLEWKKFIYSCILSTMTLLSVSLFWDSNLLLTLILIIISFLMLMITKKKEDLYLFIFVSIWGALAEAIAIAFGAWNYSLHNFIGIPIWLPLVWGNSGLFIKRTSLIIDYIRKK